MKSFQKPHSHHLLTQLIIVAVWPLFFPMSTNAISYNLDINFTDNLVLTDNGILLFQAENVVPGDTFLTDLTVTNHTSMQVHFAIDDIYAENPLFNESMLYQIINSSGNVIYSADSNFKQELDELKSGETKNYTIKTIVKNNASNIIQNESTVIDFIFRVYTVDEIPDVPETGAKLLQYFTPGAKSIPTYSIIIILAIIIYCKHNKDRKSESKQKRGKNK